MQSHPNTGVPGNSVPVSPCTIPPLGLGWCATLHCKADFGTNTHTSLRTQLPALSLQRDRSVRASRKHPALGTRQQPWQSSSPLLSASPAKQPEGPDGQEQLQHRTQHRVCERVGFQSSRNRGFGAQISPKYRGIIKKSKPPPLFLYLDIYLHLFLYQPLQNIWFLKRWHLQCPYSRTGSQTSLSPRHRRLLAFHGPCIALDATQLLVLRKGRSKGKIAKNKTSSLLYTTVNDCTTWKAIQRQICLFGMGSKVWGKAALHAQTSHSLVPKQLCHLK